MLMKNIVNPYRNLATTTTTSASSIVKALKRLNSESFESSTQTAILNFLKSPTHIIGGKPFFAKSNTASFPVEDPYSGDVLAHVNDCDEETVRASISVADETQKSWKNSSVQQRHFLLKNWLQLVKENSEFLANIVCLESGKTIREARSEVAYAASFIEWFAEESRRSYGRIIPPAKSQQLMVRYEPVGVSAMITPWNFPLAMLTRKIAPALAAGCACIAKPAPETPLSAMALVMLANEAQFPHGTVNLISASRDNSSMVGKILCESDKVRKISFTGSTSVGKKLHEWSSSTLKRLSLELGGNAPFIILPNACLESATENLLLAKLRNSGQTCIAPNRIFVHKAQVDAFADLLAERLKKLKIGCGLDEDTDMGPLISFQGAEKFRKHILTSIESGASLIYPSKLDESRSRIVSPVILGKCTDSMLMSCEETFGPLFALHEYETIDEVVDRANKTNMGLAAYVMGPKHSTIQTKIASKLQSGMVGVDTGVISFAQVPFGGIKQSGIGREGGIEGLQAFQEIKLILSSENPDQ